MESFRLIRKHKRDRRGTSGLAMVELALVLVLLIMLTFGGMEYGWMFFNMHQLNNAARVGAREAILPDATAASVNDRINGVLNMGQTIEIDPQVNVARGALITVTVTANYNSLVNLPLLPTPATLEASVAMAKEGPA